MREFLSVQMFPLPSLDILLCTRPSGEASIGCGVPEFNDVESAFSCSCSGRRSSSGSNTLSPYGLILLLPILAFLAASRTLWGESIYYHLDAEHSLVTSFSLNRRSSSVLSAALSTESALSWLPFHRDEMPIFSLVPSFGSPARQSTRFLLSQCFGGTSSLSKRASETLHTRRRRSRSPSEVN